MTDQHGGHRDATPVGRPDLRALDAAADDRRDELVIRAVMARVQSSTRAPDIVRTLRRLHRVMAAAAILLAVLATSVVMNGQRADEIGAAELLESWVQSSHVPTNGELLTVYQGYRP